MKKNLFYFVLIVSLLSCSKNDDSKTIIEGTIKYKINGELVTYDNKSVESPELLDVAGSKSKVEPFNDPFYVIEGHSPFSNKELFQAMIFTDSLMQMNYHMDTTDLDHYGVLMNIDHNYPQIQSSLHFAGDYVDITITSYSNGKVSGTFTAKLSPITDYYYEYNKRGSILITEGEFSNVKLTSFN